jgi:membrane-associated protease RseP (regulator of RpoE activity)
VRRIIVDVVKDSPAEKAGLVAGDTLVRFNGLQPRSELLGAFEPGDTIVLRLRRNGREREVRVVAAERPNVMTGNFTFEVLPDSIRKSIAIMVDAVRADIDTVRFPRMRIERLRGDSTIVYFGNDRIMAMPRDLDIPIHLDSIRTFMLRHSPGDWKLFADSGHIRIWGDSIRGGAFSFFGGDSSRVRVWSSDSTIGLRRIFPGDSNFVEMYTARPGGRVGWIADSMVVRPFEMMTRNFTVGMRAIAGAELFELNPELGETFGTLEGVLVLNASDGTPAANAGLRGGDVIVSADGKPITSITSLRRTIEAVRPGGVVKLEVLRRGTRTTVNLNRQ